jgi:putative membrane protein
MAAFAAPPLRTLSHTPYCGAPPSPADLLQRWNLDPILIVALAAVVVVFAVRAGKLAPWRRACFYGGWTVLALALTSPLCALSVSLFSARVGQHMILTAVAAPLLALGRPLEALRAGTRGRAPHAMPAALAYTLCLWLWHAPGPYLATFQSDLVYWAMHLTTIGAAFWLWSALLEVPSEGLAGFVGATLLTTVQMGLLGAVITLAGRPIYAPHFLTTADWGLTALEDQALGGAIMWVPAGAIFIGAFAFAFIEALRRAEARSLARSAA